MNFWVRRSPWIKETTFYLQPLTFLGSHHLFYSCWPWEESRARWHDQLAWPGWQLLAEQESPVKYYGDEYLSRTSLQAGLSDDLLQDLLQANIVVKLFTFKNWQKQKQNKKNIIKLEPDPNEKQIWNWYAFNHNPAIRTSRSSEARSSWIDLKIQTLPNYYWARNVGWYVVLLFSD